MDKPNKLPLGDEVKQYRNRFIQLFSLLFISVLVVTVSASSYLFWKEMKRSALDTADTIKNTIIYIEYHHISNPEHGYQLDEHHYQSLQEYVMWVKKTNPNVSLIVYYDKSQEKVIGTTNPEWYHLPLSALPERHLREDLERIDQKTGGGRYFQRKVFDFSYYMGNTLLIIHLDAYSFWKNLIFSTALFSLLILLLLTILFLFTIQFLKRSIFFPLHNVLQKAHETSPFKVSKFQPESKEEAYIKPTFLNIISKMIRNDLNALEFHEKWIFSIVKAHPTPSFMVNPLGEIIFINDQLHAILKKPLEDQNINWLEYVVEEDKSRIQDAWDQQVHNLQLFEQQFRLKNTENQSFWVFGQCVALKNAKDQTIGFMGTLFPIDRWKK